MKPARSLPHVVLVVALSAVPVWGADSPLGVLPDSAGAIARFRQPKATIDAVAKFASSVDSKQGSQVRKTLSDYGSLVSNPKLVGVDSKLDWFVAVFPVANGLPGIVFAVPATDLNAMQQAVASENDDLQFARHENWLFYSDSQSAIDSVKQGIDGQSKGIDSAFDAESRSALDRHDVAVWINVRKITRELYKDELEIAKDEIEKAVADIASLTPQQDGVDLKPVFEAYAKMAHATVQAVIDLRALTIGLSVRPTGIEHEWMATVEPGSPTAAFLAQSKPSAMPLFDRLPHDRFLYLGTHGDMQAFTELNLKIATAFVQDPSKARDIASVVSAYSQLRIGSQVHAIGVGDMKAGLLRATTLIEVDAPDRMRDLMRRSTTLLTAATGGPAVPSVEYRQGAETVTNVSVDVVAVRAPQQNAPGTTTPIGAPGTAAPGADPAAAGTAPMPGVAGPINGTANSQPAQQAANRLLTLLYGPAGVESRIAFLSDMVVQTQGGGQDAMAEALKQATGVKPKSGSGTAPPPRPDPALVPTRSQLSPEANFYAFLDVPSMMVELFKAWTASKNPQQAQPTPVRSGRPAPPPPDPMKQLGIKPSYIGMSVAAEPAGVRMKIFVPLKQVQGMTKMDELVMEFIRLGGMSDLPGGGMNFAPGGRSAPIPVPGPGMP